MEKWLIGSDDFGFDSTIGDELFLFPYTYFNNNNYSPPNRLLNEQVGVVNFEPYEETFVHMYSVARLMFSALPLSPPLETHLHRNWKEASGKDLLPVISMLFYKKYSTLDESWPR